MKVGLTAWCIGFCWGVFQGWFCEMRRHTTGWKGVRQNLSSTCEGVRLVLGSCSDRSRRWAASVAGWLLYPPHWMLTGVVDYDGIFKRVIIVIPDERKGMDGKAYGRTVTFSWTAASFFFLDCIWKGFKDGFNLDLVLILLMDSDVRGDSPSFAKNMEFFIPVSKVVP